MCTEQGQWKLATYREWRKRHVQLSSASSSSEEALCVNSESRVSDDPTLHGLSSGNSSPHKAFGTRESVPLGCQKTRKSRASCLGSTMFSTVRSMACTCSGEAVKKAKGPMRCSAHEWQR